MWTLLGIQLRLVSSVQKIEDASLWLATGEAGRTLNQSAYIFYSNLAYQIIQKSFFYIIKIQVI